MASGNGNGVVDPLADNERQSARGVADPRHEQPVVWQCRAHAAQYIQLVVKVDVVQDIQNDDDIGLAEVGRANIADFEIAATVQCTSRSFDIFRHQLQTENLAEIGWRWPVRPPVAGIVQRPS